MSRVLYPLVCSLVFLLANILILALILVLNRRPANRPRHQAAVALDQAQEQSQFIDPTALLGWEFAYAQSTASEAMQDRHTMVNFYLLMTGVVASGVLAMLGKDASLPRATGTILLWVLCAVGWIYFLNLIRLRQAWHDSARAMNQIKEFCITHARECAPETLRRAFLWQPQTLPAPDRAWTVFFYSAALIGLLDSLAFAAGGLLIDLEMVLAFPWFFAGWLGAMAIILCGFHIWLYFEFLR
jgi:hypothetical protein